MEIKTRNTNTLAPLVYDAIWQHGVEFSSRNGPVRRIMEPVSICLTHPYERVNFCPVRDANPYFHMFEGLAMLGNMNSVALMAFFAKPISQYSDDGATFNAFYGTRARSHFGFDQLANVITELRFKSDSRQCVVQLWDPQDLQKTTKDKACNLCMLFDVRPNKRLNMTTYNRSNDAVLGGVTGANIVHLSMFHEYVAGSLDLNVGEWWHISNNLHVYTEQAQWQKVSLQRQSCNLYDTFTDPHVDMVFGVCEKRGFDLDLHKLLGLMSAIVMSWEKNPMVCVPGDFTNFFIAHVAIPMWNSWQQHKAGNAEAAVFHASAIKAPDWRMACIRWLERRAK